MDPKDPLFVDVIVPQAVLLSSTKTHENRVLHPNDAGAVWYHADFASLTCTQDGSVELWHPQERLGNAAKPVKPNEGHLRLSDKGGLNYQSEINAGVVVPDALIDPAQFTIAVRYTSPDGEARSLLTINPSDHDTYLFLSEKDGTIEWQDQQDQASLSVPAPKGGGWIVAGYHNGHLSVLTARDSKTLGPALQTALASDDMMSALTGANDLFIGCRSHRKGILKTLGTSRIHDVLLWIDQDYCTGDQAALASVLRYCERKGTPA